MDRKRGKREECTTPSTNNTYTTHTRNTHTNPPDQVRYWDDRSVLALIRADYPFFLPTFKSYKQVVQRSDAARWLILYKVGRVRSVEMDEIAVGCLAAVVAAVLQPPGAHQEGLPAATPCPLPS